MFLPVNGLYSPIFGKRRAFGKIFWQRGSNKKLKHQAICMLVKRKVLMVVIVPIIFISVIEIMFCHKI